MRFIKVALIVFLLLTSFLITNGVMDQFGERTVLSCTDMRIENKTGIFITHIGCDVGSSSMEENETITLLLWEDFFNSSNVQENQQ